MDYLFGFIAFFNHKNLDGLVYARVSMCNVCYILCKSIYITCFYYSNLSYHVSFEFMVSPTNIIIVNFHVVIIFLTLEFLHFIDETLLKFMTSNYFFIIIILVHSAEYTLRVISPNVFLFI